MLVVSPLVRQVIGCAIEVHAAIGPGLLESAYERCFAHELAASGIKFRSEVPLPITYKDVVLSCGYRLDFLIEDWLLVELKSVDRVLPIHHAQLLTYLKLARLRQGLLINFNVRRLAEGIKSFLM